LSEQARSPKRSPLSQDRIAFRGRAFKVRIETITKPNGSSTTREIVDHSDSVAIVAVDSLMNCILERQHRHATGKVLLEIPAGGVEPGETPDDCARRELREETGYLPNRIKRIGGFYSAPGFCTEYLHLYLAAGLEHSPLHASDTDEITLVRVPVDGALQLISSGEIQDAKSIAGLLTVLAFHRAEIEELCGGRPGAATPDISIGGQ